MANPSEKKTEDQSTEQCIGEPTEPTNIVIFGAGGDLTKRKLIPALVKMLRCDLLHHHTVIYKKNYFRWHFIC